jgi:hypothetical protein
MRTRLVWIGSLLIFSLVAAFMVDKLSFDEWQEEVIGFYSRLSASPDDKTVRQFEILAQPDALKIDQDGAITLAFYPPRLAWIHRRSEEIAFDSSYAIEISPRKDRHKPVVSLHHGSD